ncbi:MAG: hydrogenase nickel incorporation protein HypB [Clostridiales bacterium]|jgi:hydrogenase nickel incorporation protein HypB|nr:hydrogenase nickel incorporation protein HypB [Clostridiales bacterium]
MPRINVNKDVKDLNRQQAEKNREIFLENAVFTINIIGSPGAGKTTLLENILPILAKKYRICVIEGDLETDNDAERIRKANIQAVQINTNGGCHLDAFMIAKELKALDLANKDLLIIENVGNLVCPTGFDLGEDMRIVVMSIAEGDDKPKKYPVAVVNTDAIVLTKTDLLPYIDADIEKMRKTIFEIKPEIKLFETKKASSIYEANELIAHIEKSINTKSR